MRILSITILLLVSLNTSASICPALKAEKLSETQIAVLYNSFLEGKKNNMSYSLAAIGWKESSAGEALVNPNDPSAGVFQVTLPNALSYMGWEDTKENRNKIQYLLINDFQLAAHFAMINLQFWKTQYGENWKLVWRRYNGGYSDSQRSINYSEDIAKRIQTIRLCGWR